MPCQKLSLLEYWKIKEELTKDERTLVL